MKIQIRPSAKAAGSKSPTTASRKKLEGSGQAMPGGRYPIPNVDFLKRAVRSVGRTPPEKRPAVVAWIKKRAGALGQPKVAANLSNAADYALNLANQKDAVELAGAPTGTGEVTPQTVKRGSGASKKQVVSKVKNTPLKTKEGKMNYAKLRAQGYAKHISLKAAQQHEQGLVNSELSNDHIDGALEFAFTRTASASDGPRMTVMGTDGSAKDKLGLKHPLALKAYAKARKRGLPHAVAMQGAKMIDKKHKDDELSNSPKA